MILIVCPRWLRKNFNGMALWPFVLVRYPHLMKNKLFVNHERIHLRQQLELLLIFFFIWYLLEFLIRWIQIGDKHMAYHNISFEREAYFNENDPSYLKNRKFWSFLKYIKTK